ncbi:MAG: RNA polymerase sigma factor [Pseudobdellovibrionaceae bacterium]
MKQLEPDWHQIVNDLGPCLYRYFCGIFPQSQASDLVQESLIRLVQKHRNGEFSSSRGSLKSYTFGIARYIRLEAQKDRPEFDLVEDEASLDVPGEPKDLFETAHLRWAIRQLKPIEQEIILLMIDTESSLEEIAVGLNLPIGTVKSHVHRAKENLRQIMEVKNESQR